MYVRKKKYPSGNVGIIAVAKVNGKMRELVTVVIAKSEDEVESLVPKVKECIDQEQRRRHPRLDLFGDERRKCEQERMDAERLLSSITNITINGADLILVRVFDNVDLNSIKPEMVAEATANAREAADKFATDSHSDLGKIKTASQGQFSIEDRDQYTPYIKTVRVVTSITYYLED